MWWLIPVIGLILGVYFGQFLHIEIPAEMVKYLSIGIMAALDSVFGGIRALYERKFDSLLMLSGFFANALLAGALAYIGDMLSVDLYYAAVFAFGVRLFSNLSLIRVNIIGNLREKDRLFRAQHQEFDPDPYRDFNPEFDDEDDGEDGEDEDDEDDEDDGDGGDGGYDEYDEDGGPAEGGEDGGQEGR